MLRYMLDTNQVSYIVRGTSQTARRTLANMQAANNNICISSITEAELLFGLARQPNAKTLHAAMMALFAKLEILPWRHEEAAVYGVLRAKQESQGKSLDPMDMLIAAHAVSTMSILVSRDRVFTHVPDLTGLVNWATDLV